MRTKLDDSNLHEENPLLKYVICLFPMFRHRKELHVDDEDENVTNTNRKPDVRVVFNWDSFIHPWRLFWPKRYVNIDQSRDTVDGMVPSKFPSTSASSVESV
mmetsp:Transcript_27662/g.23714  ORF Transcript_27662/g.23714 Transcript_27662/m.23714 type:complete len:102 (-) Transcript_27662:89-394(-)